MLSSSPFRQNENRLTKKLRVVFDASTKTESGLSLNDVLQKGPSIQEKLIHILARFRTRNFVLTADIKKNVPADTGL